MLHHPDPAGGLVGQQGDQLVGESPERRRVGLPVPERGQFVGDERMVDDVQAHAGNLSVSLSDVGITEVSKRRTSVGEDAVSVTSRRLGEWMGLASRRPLWPR